MSGTSAECSEGYAQNNKTILIIQMDSRVPRHSIIL